MAATPVISFSVMLEGYGELTIENLTVAPFPNANMKTPFAAPPLEHPVTASPSAAIATPASTQGLATSLMNEPWGGFMRAISRRFGSLASRNSTCA